MSKAKRRGHNRAHRQLLRAMRRDAVGFLNNYIGEPIRDDLEHYAALLRTHSNIVDARADHGKGCVVAILKQPLNSISFNVSTGEP